MIYFLLMISFFLILQVAVGWWEKHLVWPYDAPEQAPRYGDPSGYGGIRVFEALSMGFTCLGWAPDFRGKMYKMSYALLFSPERDCFMIVTVGTVANIPVAGTTLFTKEADGRALYTTDNQSSVQLDITRKWKSQLVRRATFAMQLAAHREAVASTRMTPIPFTPGAELKDYYAMRDEHYRSMKQAGVIVYADSEERMWRYSFLGSVRAALLNYSIGLMRGSTDGRVPKIW